MNFPDPSEADPAPEIRKMLFHKRKQCFCFFRAVGIAQEALPLIAGAVESMLFHFAYSRSDRSFSSAHFIIGDDLAFVVEPHQRAYPEDSRHSGSSSGDSAAPFEHLKIRAEKLMVDTIPVLFDPGRDLLHALSLITQIRRRIH